MHIVLPRTAPTDVLQGLTMRPFVNSSVLCARRMSRPRFELHLVAAEGAGAGSEVGITLFLMQCGEGWFSPHHGGVVISIQFF